MWLLLVLGMQLLIGILRYWYYYSLKEMNKLNNCFHSSIFMFLPFQCLDVVTYCLWWARRLQRVLELKKKLSSTAEVIQEKQHNSHNKRINYGTVFDLPVGWTRGARTIALQRYIFGADRSGKPCQ